MFENVREKKNPIGVELIKKEGASIFLGIRNFEAFFISKEITP